MIGRRDMTRESSHRMDRHAVPSWPMGATFPLWLILTGNVVMVFSLWLLGAGGMVAKMILLAFWGGVLLPGIGRATVSGDVLAGMAVLVCLVILIAAGDGAGIEKARLVGNLLMLPVGLVAGYRFGRACLPVLVPAMVLYLAFFSTFHPTHEGMRLNHPFLFLGLVALCSVGAGRGAVAIGGLAAIAVFLSQTRIAVAAMIVNLLGIVRLSRPLVWLSGAVMAGAVGWWVRSSLPRLLQIHDSGRLVFWRDFADKWMAASTARQWMGFGAGSVEETLSGHASFSSFGALHNDHFRILFETGMAGATLWLAGWGMMVWLLRKSRLAVCILLSVAVTMLTDNTLNYGHYLVCCGIAAGIAARIATGTNRGRSNHLA